MTTFHEAAHYAVPHAEVVVEARADAVVDGQPLARGRLASFGRGLLRQIGMCAVDVAEVVAQPNYSPAGGIDGVAYTIRVIDLHVLSARRPSSVPRDCGCG